MVKNKDAVLSILHFLSLKDKEKKIVDLCFVSLKKRTSSEVNE